MNEFKRAKEAYHHTPIPDELPERIQAGIQEGKARYQKRHKRPVHRWIAAAACFGLMLAGLNLSPTMYDRSLMAPVEKIVGRELLNYQELND